VPVIIIVQLLFARDPPRVSAIRERSLRLHAARASALQKGSVVRLDGTFYIGHMALKRMDNVGIVVDDLGGPDVSLDWAISASRLP
jgi:hypothetical protein